MNVTTAYVTPPRSLGATEMVTLRNPAAAAAAVAVVLLAVPVVAMAAAGQQRAAKARIWATVAPRGNGAISTSAVAAPGSRTRVLA
jgi:hypothetical protein